MGSLPIDDYYELLGVDTAADGEAVRRAWRRLAARWHPDRAGVAATEQFHRIAAAYEVLSDPLARAAYDRRFRRNARPARTAPPATASVSAPAVMLGRLCGPLDSLLVSGAARLDEPGVITLVLREAEAAQGGMVSISMYVGVWCPNCAPRNPPPAGCPRCGGSGTVEELFSAWLAVRPGVKEGEVLAPTAELPGMVGPVRFRVRYSATASAKEPRTE